MPTSLGYDGRAARFVAVGAAASRERAGAMDARPLPRQASSGRAASLRNLCADGALACTFAAVLGLFAASPLALEAAGFAYLSSGGGVLAKVHPATIVAVAAMVLRWLATGKPVAAAWQAMTADAGVVLLLLAAGMAMAFAGAFFGTPVTPVIDTFILPVLIFLLLRDLNSIWLRRLAWLTALLLIANAALAMVEFLKGWHLIAPASLEATTGDPTRTDARFSWTTQLASDWRANALLGHPLVNGLIVGAFTLCLLAPAAGWLPLSIRVALIATQVAALFTFGARAALVLTAILGLYQAGLSWLDALRRGFRITPRHLAIVLCGAGLAVAVLGALYATGFLDRPLARFGSDAGSATTRLTMLELPGLMSVTDFLLHPDKDLVATVQRLYGLEFGIESSWLGLMLTYGVAIAAMLLAGLGAFTRSVLRASGTGAGAIAVFFFLLVSVSASLSGKSTTVAMTVALILLFLPRGRPAIHPSAPRSLLR